MTDNDGEITISGLTQAKKRKRNFDAVLTLEDPGARQSLRLRFNRRPAPDHLVLTFEDFDSDQYGVWVATENDLVKALEFGRRHHSGTLLIHCHHGLGRSPAIALAMIADRLTPGREGEAVAKLFEIRPEATPNLVVVSLADKVLNRGSALITALAAHEQADPSFARRRDERMKLFHTQPGLFALRDL